MILGIIKKWIHWRLQPWKYCNFSFFVFKELKVESERKHKFCKVSRFSTTLQNVFLDSKPLGGTKVNSSFHPSKVDQISTRSSWGILWNFEIYQALILRTKLNANYFMAILKNRVVAKKLKRWLIQIQLDNLISKICYKERA